MSLLTGKHVEPDPGEPLAFFTHLSVAIIPSVGNRLTLNVLEANNRQRCLAFCCV